MNLKSKWIRVSCPDSGYWVEYCICNSFCEESFAWYRASRMGSYLHCSGRGFLGVVCMLEQSSSLSWWSVQPSQDPAYYIDAVVGCCFTSDTGLTARYEETVAKERRSMIVSIDNALVGGGDTSIESKEQHCSSKFRFRLSAFGFKMILSYQAKKSRIEHFDTVHWNDPKKVATAKTADNDETVWIFPFPLRGRLNS